MRRPVLLTLALFGCLALATCGVGGRGLPVPTLTSDFLPGAEIPGWVLSLPGGGRAEVTTQSQHADGRWNVILRKALRPVPRDLNFGVAVADDGRSHSGIANLRWTADPAATPNVGTLVSRRVPNGSIVPDGVSSPGEWPGLSVSILPLTPKNDLPAGMWPLAGTVNLFAQSAYDDEYVYFLFRWNDPGQRKSNLGPLLEWNGSAWFLRPHRTNDANGDGLLNPGETMTLAAAAEDEDRLFLFWPIHDSVQAFQSGGPGCAASCHQNTALNSTGAEALHAWTAPDDRSDVWHWRAAASAPSRRADDRLLVAGNPALGLSGGGSGFQADAGAGPYSTQDSFQPVRMFSSSVGTSMPLVEATLTFGGGVAPGYPVLPSVPGNSAPYAPANFNNTSAAPAPWTGIAPFFGNNYLPPYIATAPDESRADLEVDSSFSGIQWTVEFRRRRVTRDAAGAPRQDDVQFDDDANFFRDGYQTVTAASGLPFSISITDAARGHGTRETLYPGPLRLSRDEALTGPALQQDLLLHDYGTGFAPMSVTDFVDLRETRPLSMSGTDRQLVLKAGTNGGQDLFVAASWDDASLDAARDHWIWNGFSWMQAGDEDELRLLWNGISAPAVFAQMGCAAFCHAAGGPFGAPSQPHFSTASINDLADLWHWRAGRSAPLGFCDDASVDWRFYDLLLGSSGSAATHADAGRPLFNANSEPSREFPIYMAAADPNANAAQLTLGVPPIPDVIPFLDVLGNLPPPPPTGGGSVSFAQQVLPIFQARCTVCHPPTLGINLASYAGVLAGGLHGPIVIPANPSQSTLILSLTGAITPQMPFGGPYLSSAQIQLISDWIAQGAANN